MGIALVMASSGVCCHLWVSVCATSGCPARRVAGVRQAEAAGFTAALSPRPAHLARGRDERDREELKKPCGCSPASKERRK